jgi:hypothetical protein
MNLISPERIGGDAFQRRYLVTEPYMSALTTTDPAFETLLDEFFEEHVPDVTPSEDEQRRLDHLRNLLAEAYQIGRRRGRQEHDEVEDRYCEKCGREVGTLLPAPAPVGAEARELHRLVFHSDLWADSEQ